MVTASQVMWMLRTELDEHEVDATYVDHVVHVSAFPKIAALERARVCHWASLDACTNPWCG